MGGGLPRVAALFLDGGTLPPLLADPSLTTRPLSHQATSDPMGRIAMLARSGRLDQAADEVAKAFAAGATDPVLAALGGAIEFHRGQFLRAIPYLEQAARAHPQDLTVRGNLAESYRQAGRRTDALTLCDPASARADRSLRLAALGAHIAQEAEDFATSATLYRIIIAARPDDWSALNNLGNALGPLGDHAGAVEMLRRAARLAPDAAPIQLNLGNALVDAGRPDEAEQQFRAAAERFPTDPKPLTALFGLYRDWGREDEAYAAIEQAAARAPGDASIQSDFGQEAARRNLYAVAEAAFERALALDPALGPAFVGLATVYERMNREAELEPLRERAMAAGLDAPSLAFIDALRFKRAERFDEAFAALEAAGDVVVVGRKLHLRGLMLDRLGRHDEAFAAFTEMNLHWQTDPSRPRERAADYRAAVLHSTALLTPEWIAGWSPPPPSSERPTPIFLVGFPRSGTTLLDTMLMADPSVRVLEEEPFIGELERELGGIDALPALSTEAILAARDSYFARAAQVVPDLIPDHVIVDKHPMHLNKVPMIRRLFPEARFVLALRHPCDVLLSCFLTNFRINNAMANFLDLEDAATLYDQTFHHWDLAREVFDLPVGTVVYERLVENQARELAPLFDWLSLDWPGERFDHREAARARGTVATASYAQVTEPIYRRAAGRWTRYRDHLAPVFDRLRPWVERFGYALDDGRIPGWPDSGVAGPD